MLMLILNKSFGNSSQSADIFKMSGDNVSIFYLNTTFYTKKIKNIIKNNNLNISRLTF